MIPLKTLLFTIIGIIFGYFFEDEIRGFQYYHLLLPTLFGLAVLSILYRKYKIFKKRTFISSIFDTISQAITLLFGIALSIAVLNYWIPNSFFHWMLLTLGVAAIISGVLYEKTIQLHIKENLLTIEYVSKGKYELSSIDSHELKNGTLTVHSNGRRIEVYNVKMETENTEKLFAYLTDFQRKGNTNANKTFE